MRRCIKLLKRLRHLTLSTSKCLLIGTVGVSLIIYSQWLKDSMKPKPDPLASFRLNVPQHVVKIYSNLARLSGHRGKLNGIYMWPSLTPNAFVNEKGDVYVTAGLILDAKNDDELAFVIAHEISHVMLRHTTEENEVDNRLKEYHSDMLGLALVIRAGYNPCAATGLFERWQQYSGTNITTVSHPAAEQRKEYTKLPMCSTEGAFI